ncbi:peptidoglycan-binding protein [Streptomyces sp. NPDC051018]|uniref:peptidoglycan-binding protein n=1 Tax=Streptomyces sp. NPDC051018 TaxID=3365639 RepID=UPI0037B469F7
MRTSIRGDMLGEGVNHSAAWRMEMLPYHTLPGGIPGIEQPGPNSIVELLQRVLRREGAYGGPVNGGFTPETATAVKNFQAAHGLPTDGVVGPDTWDALPAEDLQGVPVISEGDTGGAVALLQRCLRRQGFDPGPVNGVFGPETTTALRQYQETGAPEIVVDGICGFQIWPLMG